MLITITNCIVTCYLATGHLTSDGHVPKAGITVACADRSIPLGSKCIIDNHTYIIQDHTNKRFHDRRIDIFTNGSHAQALEFGKQHHTVTIIIP